MRIWLIVSLCFTALIVTLPFEVDGDGIMFNHVYAPEHGLVRPMERPYRREICLNGLWRFEPLPLPSGYKPGAGPPRLPAPEANGWSKTPIRIPSPWNVDSFGGGNGYEFDCFPSYPKSWNSAPMGWLKLAFKFPADWSGKQTYLHFMSIVGAARIVVNGHRMADHFNNFLPFEVNITKAIKSGGRNELLVGIRKPDLFKINGPYRSKYTYPTGSFWGMHVVGIDQDVFLQVRPVLHVSNVFIQPLVDRDTLQVLVKVTNGGQTRQSFTLGAQVRPWKWLESQNEITAPESKSALGGVALRVAGPHEYLAPGQSKTFTLAVKVNNALALWTLTHPRLYGLITSLRGAHGTLDRKYDRFGWRQWSIRGRQLLLNGKPVKLNADAWHFLGVPAMTPRYVWAWFTMLKKAHCNAVRLHAQPRPPFFLKMADQMGIAVLDEGGIWASHCGFNYWQSATWRRFGRALRSQVLRDRNHPSVFGWSVANEIKAAMYVVHAPPGVQTMVTGKVVNLAHMVEAMDPTRPWVSSDGDGDMNGRLPVYVAHYGTPRDWVYHAHLNKPFAVGECTETYYSTPPMVAKLEGDRAYKNMKDYMEGLSIQAYQDAVAERKLCTYGALWNLVWYGLKPLPLGLTDQQQPATLKDGIFFRSFVPNQPGMQPERLGPYCTTLNPGYDPRLPLFEPWPFWQAICAARAPGGPLASRWAKAPTVRPLPRPLPPTIHQVDFAGSRNGRLYKELIALRVPLRSVDDPRGNALMIVDAHSISAGQIAGLGRNARAAAARGGTVLVLNVGPASLATINRLLPRPMILTNRRAASLLASRRNGLTAPLSLADLYFGQDHDPYIMTHGMTGPLVTNGKTLLWACPTNWLAWTRKPEYLKTACLFESGQLKKPAGAALVEYPFSRGRLLVSTIRFVSDDQRKIALLRRLLVDLRVDLAGSTRLSHRNEQQSRKPGSQRPLK